MFKPRGLVLALGLAVWAGKDALPAPAPATSSAPASRPVPAADEALVARLIEQMGAPAYKTRQQAYEKLKTIGPGIVPVLVKYRSHADPEIRQRVEDIIAGYKWMTRGAIILRIDPGTQAEQLGFKPGDVLIKIDDYPIAGHRDMSDAPADQERTYYLWRSGTIVPMKVGPGRVGFYASNWDFAKGGNNHARGIAALAEKRFEEAHQRLLAAWQEGMDDPWTHDVLVGLAEYALEHKTAMEIYAKVRKRLEAEKPDECSWSHYDLGAGQQDLPLTSAHTAYLLERMRTEKFSLQLYHQLEGYAATGGVNVRLARELLAKPWPPEPAPSDHERWWNLHARMTVALFDRKWDDALKAHAAAGKAALSTDGLDQMAVQAAIHAGDVEAACASARRILKKYLPADDRRYSGYLTYYEDSAVLLAVAAATAAGRDDLARDLLSGFERVDKEYLEHLVGADNHDAWLHAGIAPLVRPFLRSAVTGTDQEFLNLVLLSVTKYAPDLAESDWTDLYTRHSRGERIGRYFEWLNAFALARMGKSAQAKEAYKRFADKDYSGKEPFIQAMDFLVANADRLEQDWSALKGACQLYPAAEKGARWLVRWDGRTLYLDPSGAIHEYAGLAAGQVHRGMNGDSIKTFPTGTIYIRRSQIYFFDDKKKEWLATFASPCRVPAHEDYWDDPTGPLVLRYVMENYPAGGPGRELLRRLNAVGGWRFYEFNGDLVIAANPDTLKIVNLSHEIGRLAGVDGPAAVYRIPMQERYNAPYVPSDCGLWRMNGRGELARVDLPLKQPNVMVRVLSWPVREGKLYVGVAPQQGGQILELDRDTGRWTVTGGYCGIGPDDAFAWMMYDRRGKRLVGCEYAIQALYDKRLAGEKGEPATRPATGRL